MGGRRHVFAVALTLGLAAAQPACPGAARAESLIVLPKPGQVGLSVGGGYGTLVSSGNVGVTFGAGPALCVRLRYRMRYERGLGLSFESQSLDAREVVRFDLAFPDSVAPTRLSLITSGVEFYQMFGTRTRTTRMLMVGAGIAQMRAELNDGSTDVAGRFGGDGLYVSAGAGVERFFFRSWAYDLSARYLAVFREGKPNHDLQAALGLIFYASY